MFSNIHNFNVSSRICIKLLRKHANEAILAIQSSKNMKMMNTKPTWLRVVQPSNEKVASKLKENSSVMNNVFVLVRQWNWDGRIQKQLHYWDFVGMKVFPEFIQIWSYFTPLHGLWMILLRIQKKLQSHKVNLNFFCNSCSILKFLNDFELFLKGQRTNRSDSFQPSFNKETFLMKNIPMLLVKLLRWIRVLLKYFRFPSAAIEAWLITSQSEAWFVTTLFQRTWKVHGRMGWNYNS